MPNFNKVYLMGNLTRDPELKTIPSSGTSVCEFGLAINRKWKDREETTFVDCQAWAKSAELISEYCAKGRPLFVEGRLKLDQWEGRDGQKRSKLRVVVENFQFLGDRRTGAPADSAGQQEAGNARTPEAPQDSGFQVEDDIPF